MENRTEVDDMQLDCENGVPSFGQFFSEIQDEKFVIVIYPVTFCIFIVFVYSKNLRNLMEIAPKSIKSNCISVVSIYPIVSFSSLIAILVPRAYFFMDTVGHVSFMIISYQLYRLLIAFIELFCTIDEHFPLDCS